MRADTLTWAAVWQAVGNTMFGYAVWGWLMARYPAATIALPSLLVPVFGRLPPRRYSCTKRCPAGSWPRPALSWPAWR